MDEWATLSEVENSHKGEPVPVWREGWVDELQERNEWGLAVSQSSSQVHWQSNAPFCHLQLQHLQDQLHPSTVYAKTSSIPWSHWIFIVVDYPERGIWFWWCAFCCYESIRGRWRKRISMVVSDAVFVTAATAPLPYQLSQHNHLDGISFIRGTLKWVIYGLYIGIRGITYWDYLQSQYYSHVSTNKGRTIALPLFLCTLLSAQVNY